MYKTTANKKQKTNAQQKQNKTKINSVNNQQKL